MEPPPPNELEEPLELPQAIRDFIEQQIAAEQDENARENLPLRRTARGPRRIRVRPRRGSSSADHDNAPAGWFIFGMMALFGSFLFYYGYVYLGQAFANRREKQIAAYDAVLLRWEGAVRDDFSEENFQIAFEGGTLGTIGSSSKSRAGGGLQQVVGDDDAVDEKGGGGEKWTQMRKSVHLMDVEDLFEHDTAHALDTSAYKPLVFTSTIELVATKKNQKPAADRDDIEAMKKHIEGAGAAAGAGAASLSRDAAGAKKKADGVDVNEVVRDGSQTQSPPASQSNAQQVETQIAKERRSLTLDHVLAPQEAASDDSEVVEDAQTAAEPEERPTAYLRIKLRGSSYPETEIEPIPLQIKHVQAFPETGNHAEHVRHRRPSFVPLPGVASCEIPPKPASTRIQPAKPRPVACRQQWQLATVCLLYDAQRHTLGLDPTVRGLRDEDGVLCGQPVYTPVRTFSPWQFTYSKTPKRRSLDVVQDLLKKISHEAKTLQKAGEKRSGEEGKKILEQPEDKQKVAAGDVDARPSDRTQTHSQLHSSGAPPGEVGAEVTTLPVENTGVLRPVYYVPSLTDADGTPPISTSRGSSSVSSTFSSSSGTAKPKYPAPSTHGAPTTVGVSSRQRITIQIRSTEDPYLFVRSETDDRMDFGIEARTGYVVGIVLLFTAACVCLLPLVKLCQVTTEACVHGLVYVFGDLSTGNGVSGLLSPAAGEGGDGTVGRRGRGAREAPRLTGDDLAEREFIRLEELAGELGGEE